jgi:hypothetical protein
MGGVCVDYTAMVRGFEQATAVGDGAERRWNNEGEHATDAANGLVSAREVKRGAVVVMAAN